MNETVTVFDFREDVEIKQYSFENKVPLLIYDGDCNIDFKEIKEYISFIKD